MSKLLFFSRVALVCNLCFLVALGLQHFTFIANGVVSSTLILMGTVLAIVINSLLNLFYLLLALASKSFHFQVPKWLIITNFLFFIAQVILMIK